MEEIESLASKNACLGNIANVGFQGMSVWKNEMETQMKKSRTRDIMKQERSCFMSCFISWYIKSNFLGLSTALSTISGS